MTTRAAIYCRISDDRTGEAQGVTRQEHDCRTHATTRGWDITAVYTDNDLSAYGRNTRPAYKALCDNVRAGLVDIIVAWHPDRLHRSPRELEDFIDLLETTGTTVATVTAGDWDLATPEGRAMARIVGAIARKESEDKARRARRKALQLAQAGMVGGGGTRPYGFEPDRVTIREPEADMIRAAATAIITGRTLRAVCAEWNQAGHTTPTGRPWAAHTLRRLLCSPRVAGLRQHHDDTYPAVWPAILDQATWQQVRAIVTDPARRVNGNPRSYLLTGLAICGRCAAKLVARPRQDRTRCYVCARGPGFHGCGRLRIVAEPLEDEVVTRIAATAPELAAPAPDDPTDRLLAELAQVDADLAAVARDHYVAKVIGRPQFLAATGALEARRGDLLSAVAAAAETATWADENVVDVIESWATVPFDRRRALVARVVVSVTVGPAVRGRNRFDPDRVKVEWRV